MTKIKTKIAITGEKAITYSELKNKENFNAFLKYIVGFTDVDLYDELKLIPIVNYSIPHQLSEFLSMNSEGECTKIPSYLPAILLNHNEGERIIIRNIQMRCNDEELELEFNNKSAKINLGTYDQLFARYNS